MINHIGFIMDGNRRYSKKNNLELKEGYKKGMLQFFNVLQWQIKNNIYTTSFFALSLDNSKKRNSGELETIKTIMLELLEDPSFEDFCVKQGVLLQIRGRYFLNNRINRSLLEQDRSKLSYLQENLLNKKAKKQLSSLSFESEDELLESVERKIIEFEEKLFTIHSKESYVANIALFYDGIDEIISTTQKIAKQVQEKTLALDDIDIDVFKQASYFSNTPFPDIIVRTGDAPRISGFMLFLSAYSELYLTSKLWPELNEQDLDGIISWFNTIQRNFGK